MFKSFGSGKMAYYPVSRIAIPNSDEKLEHSVVDGPWMLNLFLINQIPAQYELLVLKMCVKCSKILTKLMMSPQLDSMWIPMEVNIIGQRRKS